MKKFISFLAAIAAAIILLPADTVMDSAERNPAGADGTAPQWEAICSDVTATVYHAVPAQCNADVKHTASMMTIDPDNVSQYRIIAMERTMMTQYGISYGDVVRVDGTGDLDGLWQVQDTMNKRFKGQHKIDFLVPESRKTGFWKNVTVSVPANAAANTAAEQLLAAS